MGLWWVIVKSIGFCINLHGRTDEPKRKSVAYLVFGGRPDAGAPSDAAHKAHAEKAAARG